MRVKTRREEKSNHNSHTFTCRPTYSPTLNAKIVQQSDETLARVVHVGAIADFTERRIAQMVSAHTSVTNGNANE